MLHVLLFCVLRCEGLADIIWQLRQQVRQLENLRTKLIPDPQNKDFNLQELLASVTELLSNLVTGYVLKITSRTKRTNLLPSYLYTILMDLIFLFLEHLLSKNSHLKL